MTYPLPDPSGNVFLRGIMKIAVLGGGVSSERNVSLVSSAAMARAARTNGHEVCLIDAADGRELDFDTVSPVGETPPEIASHGRTGAVVLDILQRLADRHTDVVINGLHGGAGENGVIQSACDLFDLPCTGSGVMASAIAMNKAVSKELFIQAGVPTAPYVYLNREREFHTVREIVGQTFHYPVVVKPNEEGSTVGLSIVKEERELQTAWQKATSYGDVIVETYIPGRELTVAVLRGRALPAIEIRPEGGFYDYLHKYTKGKTEYICPAELPDAMTTEIQAHAVKAFEVLRCSGYARIDFRGHTDGRLFCLEVNTLPGMTETSLVPKAAKAVGMDFEQLVAAIIAAALEDR